MVTIIDVAQMAGVSIGTVSNYLNHTKPVSKPVSERIQKAIDTLHYSQNLSAKSLKSNTYTDIGVILPNLNDSYYVQLFQGINNSFQNTNYYVNFSLSNDIPNIERNIVSEFLKKRICGLILVSCQPDNWKFYYDHFTSVERPLVLIDRNIRSLDSNFVSFDNYSIINNMTSSLLMQGYKDLILMTGPEKFDCEANCIDGFKNAFQQRNMIPDSNAYIKTDLSKEDAFRKTIQLLKTRKPEAIITTSESISTGIIEGLRIIGFSTKDIPVLTLGEEHWNLHTHSFANISAARPAIKLGQTASNLLIEQLESPLTKETEKIVLKDTSLSSSYVFSEQISVMTPQPDESKREIRILMMDTPQVHALQGLIKNFENHTGIHADITIMPHHNLYDEIVKNHISAEPFYDVFMYDIPWLSTLASNHVLEDLTDIFSSIDMNIFLPNSLKYFSVFEKHYFGIPFMYAPQIFYYRKDLFENPELCTEYEKLNNMSLRPPITLKEYNTIANFFTNKTTAINYGISIPAAYDECLAPEIYMRLRAYNGNVFDSKGNVCLDSAQSLKAYINFVRSIKLAKPNFKTATDVSVVQDFLQGETCMLISYPSFLTDVVDLRKSRMIGSIGYHHIPGRSPLLGGWSLGISSRSTHKEDAAEFLKWTCNEQVANYFALLGGQTAIVSTYTNDELTNLYPWLPLYHSTYQYSKPTLPPRLENNKIIPQNEIDSIVCKWIYKLIDEEIEVQEAITSTHQELVLLVQKYRK